MRKEPNEKTYQRNEIKLFMSSKCNDKTMGTKGTLQIDNA